MANARQPPAEAQPPIPGNDYALPPWWLVIGLCAAPAVLGSVILGLYFWQFSGGLSDDQGGWGQAGDFIGGVLNPFIAWVTLIVVAVTLRYTVKALQVSAEATAAAQSQAWTAQLQFENELKEQRRQVGGVKQAQRVERTLQMHQIWVSPEMLAVRREAFDVLRGNSQAPGPIFLGHLRAGEAEDRRLYYILLGVWEFLANLNTLLDSEMLDNSLFWRLFGRSIEEWADLGDRVSFNEHEGAGETPESGTTNLWFGASVRPLFIKLRQRQFTHDVAESLGLAGPR